MARIRAEDALLFETARGSGRLRLRLGEAAAKLVARDGPAQLGLSTRDAYARERLSRTGRWMDDSARLATRLGELPRIRAALVRGQIDWGMAELLARHATPETEAELLALALTPGVTVHAMRDYLGHVDEEEAAELDPTRRRCTITEVAPLEQAMFVEATRLLIEHQCGGSDYDWFEYLVAEGTATWPELLDYHALIPYRAELDDLVERIAEGVARRAEAEERAEPDLPRNDAEAGELPEPEPLPDDVIGLDRLMRRLAMQMTARDLLLGRVASDFFRAADWRSLGYATDTQYCRERLGMSRGAVWQRITLARRCAQLPALAEALSSGDIGFEAAALVARVASEATEEAWIARASERTFKHLRQEVQAKEADRALGQRGPLWPPTDAEMRDHEDFEREVLSGEPVAEVLGETGGAEIWTEGAAGAAERGEQAAAEIWTEDGASQGSVQTSASGEGATDEMDADEASFEPVQISAGSSRLVPIRIRTNEDVACFYRAARERYRELGLSQTLLMALCTWFWKTWLHEVRARYSKYDAIHRRPGCDRRLCTLHHIVFRMLGGDESWANLLTLCEKCHLDNVHDKRTLKVFGEAPYGLTFVFGREPVFTVRGRDKRAA